MPISTTRAGYFFLFSGIVTACVAASLFFAWIIFPDIFINYIVPIVVLFLPITFYTVFALAIYFKKYRISYK